MYYIFENENFKQDNELLRNENDKINKEINIIKKTFIEEKILYESEIDKIKNSLKVRNILEMIKPFLIPVILAGIGSAASTITYECFSSIPSILDFQPLYNIKNIINMEVLSRLESWGILQNNFNIEFVAEGREMKLISESGIAKLLLKMSKGGKYISLSEYIDTLSKKEYNFKPTNKEKQEMLENFDIFSEK